MTHRSTVYALIVEERFLQGEFLRSDLLPGHILSAVGQEVSQSNSEVTRVHCLSQHCYFYSTIVDSSSTASIKLDADLFYSTHTFTGYVYVLVIHPC